MSRRALRWIGSALGCLLAGCEPHVPATRDYPPLPRVAPQTRPEAVDTAEPDPDGEVVAQQLQAFLDHPDGVPFALPDPLPPEAAPRDVSGAAPTPGPAPLRCWVGGTGRDPGEFAYPRAMVSDSDGTLFVVDKAGRIQRLSPDGRAERLVRTPAIEQGKPTGLALDLEGRLLAADTHYCRVLVFDRDLSFLRAWGAPGPQPGRFMFITGVQQGADGRIYTTDYGNDVARVQVFEPDGTVVRAFGRFGAEPGEFRRPQALWVDTDADRIWVADAANHRIAIFTLEGEWVGQLGGIGDGPGQLRYPYDVKVDAQGRVWVAEFGNQGV